MPRSICFGAFFVLSVWFTTYQNIFSVVTVRSEEGKGPIAVHESRRIRGVGAIDPADPVVELSTGHVCDQNGVIQLELFEKILGSHLWGFPILLPIVMFIMYLPIFIARKLKNKKAKEQKLKVTV